jgi:predicted esterase
MDNTLVFIHGLESTARGTKGQYFSRHFPQMIIEDYVGDLSSRMEKLNHVLAGKDRLILVGSSYGGLMAVQYAMENRNKVKKLILLAPALNLSEFQPDQNRPLDIPAIIYHGVHDNIVDPIVVKRIASGCFKYLEHHFVEDDHPLQKTFSSLNWKSLLMEDGMSGRKLP